MATRRCMGCMREYEVIDEMCPFCGYLDGTPAKEAYHIEPGKLLHERYTVGRAIGFGGFGITYVAWDNKLMQKVAIKEYMPSEYATRVPGSLTVTIYDGERHAEFMSGLQKFLDEAQRLAKFQSVPGVVRIMDSFSENLTAYIVMEFLEGQTLKQYLADNGGKIPYDRAVEIILPVLSALSAVHKEGIIHRDISPDNIFLTEDGEVKLLDFGAARYASAGFSKSLSVILKPGYAPAEQYLSRGEQGPWSDVYATSATIYRMITGVVPEEALERKEKDTLKSPSSMGVKLPKNAERAILNALNVRVENRTKSAEEFESQLLATTNVVRVVEKREKRFNAKMPAWMLTAIVAACTVILIGAGLFGSGMLKLGVGNQLIFNSNLFNSGEVNTPGVINLTETEGDNLATTQGLVMYVDGAFESNTAAQGIIMAQDPDPGVKVPTGSRLKVEVSTGPKYAIIPDITDTIWNQKEAEVEALGFVPKVFYESSDLIPEGVVISLGHSAGENFQVGEKLKIVVSSGPDGELKKTPTTMPKIAGLEFEEAKRILNERGLRVIRENDQYSMTVPKGEVITQGKTEGERINTGDIVYVSISMGVEQTTVPNVKYLSKQEAISSLQKAKLAYTIKEEESETVRTGLVIRQSIEADSIVDINSNVVITVSLGKRADVPSTVNKEINRVRSELTSLGFTNVSYTGKYDKSVGKNLIISQSVSAGTRLNVDQYVEIVYSLGKMPVSITLDAAGGTVSPNSMQSFYPDTYGNLPTPKRDYYTFKGWYSANLGTTVTSGSIVPEAEYETLTAVWEEKPLSDWTRADSVPQGAQVVSRKYTYNLTEYTTSQKSSLSGWPTPYESKRELGDFESNWHWSDSPVTATDNRKVEVEKTTSETVVGYNLVSYNTQTESSPHYRYYRSYSIGGNYSGYGARASYGEFSHTAYKTKAQLNSAESISSGSWSSGGSAGKNADSATGYSFDGGIIYFIDSEKKETTITTRYKYKDRVETTIYYYKRTVSKETAENVARPSGNDISNVVEYVRYRSK